MQSIYCDLQHGDVAHVSVFFDAFPQARFDNDVLQCDVLQGARFLLQFSLVSQPRHDRHRDSDALAIPLQRSVVDEPARAKFFKNRADSFDRSTAKSRDLTDGTGPVNKEEDVKQCPVPFQIGVCIDVKAIS